MSYGLRWGQSKGWMLAGVGLGIFSSLLGLAGILSEGCSPAFVLLLILPPVFLPLVAFLLFLILFLVRIRMRNGSLEHVFAGFVMRSAPLAWFDSIENHSGTRTARFEDGRAISLQLVHPADITEVIAKIQNQAAEQKAGCSYPIRTVSIAPEWLLWQDGAVKAIALTASREPTRFHLAVLADALEDAGCADDTLLSHLRSPGAHVRGCWALESILGKR